MDVRKRNGPLRKAFGSICSGLLRPPLPQTTSRVKTKNTWMNFQFGQGWYNTLLLRRRTHPRISTLASTRRRSDGTPYAPLSAPPLIVARSRTDIKGAAFTLLTSRYKRRTRPAWLGDPKLVASYSRLEPESDHWSRFSPGKIAFNDFTSLKRVVEPPLNANLTDSMSKTLRRVKNMSLILRQSLRLDDTLEACMRTPDGISSLLQADVVARRDAIKK